MALKELKLDTLIGMDLKEAKDFIFKQGWRYKVVKQDGQSFTRPLDKREDRINLTVSSGVVTDAEIG